LLVADDDAGVCGQVGEYLGRHDFRITAVSTGKRMLDIIESEAIDLLVLEPRLSGADAIGMTRMVREGFKLSIGITSPAVPE
jgi:DNA-binding response OmpR family regulator